MAQIKQKKQRGLNSRVVFIIDDESVVRVLMRKLLQEEGYDVLEAGDGTEARQVWSQQQGKIDLLVTDLAMPDGFTGIKIVQDFRRERPTLPVIFASGYDLGDLAPKEIPPGARFIQKPFDAIAFLKLVQNILETEKGK